MNPTTAYFGVYDLIVAAGNLLLVRKTRGPYSLLLGLPGGAPETRETMRKDLSALTKCVLAAHEVDAQR